MPRVKAKRPEGRPTSYKPEYCQQIIEFFNIAPHYERIKSVTTFKDGSIKEEKELIANDFPHLITFAQKIGVSHHTLLNWGENHPEFLDALKKCKELNERMLMTNALKGLYNASFAIFTAKNKFGWRDEQYLNHESKQIVFVAHKQIDNEKNEKLSHSINRISEEKVSFLDTTSSGNEPDSINDNVSPSKHN